MDKSAGATVKWSTSDDAKLVDFLVLEKGRIGGTDNGNFKPESWTKAVDILAGSESISGGIRKDAASIKSHWQKVRHNTVYCA